MYVGPGQQEEKGLSIKEGEKKGQRKSKREAVSKKCPSTEESREGGGTLEKNKPRPKRRKAGQDTGDKKRDGWTLACMHAHVSPGLG